jgi:ATP-dependent helicase/nuclease subunit B
MMTFIEQLASKIFASTSELQNVIVVFPNRRPAAFLYKALGKLSPDPIFAPQCYSIRDFIFSLSKLRQTDNITLLFKLYDIYRETNQNDNSREFEHFISSGELMLSDFNDIDHSMVNAEQLFSNLDEAKAIELWNPQKGELTETEKNYLDFFQKLQDYYNAFRSKLTAEGMAYDGMAYRSVAEEIQEGQIIADRNKKYVFAGFNALNEAEKIIIEHFSRHADTMLFWDADHGYLDDEKQEAGVFLRKNLQLWPNDKIQSFGSDLLGSEKSIHIIGAPLHLSQSKYAGVITAELHTKEPESIHSTVIVPADESTLPQLLDSIPCTIEQVNITMGYSLKQSAVYTITESLINMHIHAAAQSKRKKTYRFNYSDIISFFRHPLFDTICGSETSGSGKLITDKILVANKLFYTEPELEMLFSDSLQKDISYKILPFIHKVSHPEELAEYCLKLCSDIYEKISENDTLNRLMCQKMYDAVLQIFSYLGKAGFPVTFQGFHLLFQRIVSGIQVPFEGEPLGGLQIMGFLETRCLDFKNIILTNFNEGFMPAVSRKMLTFIPFDIRKAFGMNVPGHKDAMYAYYFLRLIQRAENIWILYNTEPDPFSGKEESRFIRQIEYELGPASNGKWSVSRKILRIPSLSSTPPKHPGIEKSNAVMAKLREIHNNGYSASGLSIYLDCPFRFYLSRILLVKETPVDIDDSVSMNVLGDIVHATLKTIYNESLQIITDQVFFEKAKKNAYSILLSKFDEYYKGGDMSRGKNLIIKEVAHKMVLNVIQSDMNKSKESSILPLFLEDGTLRISDYKTGRVEQITLLKKGEQEDDLDFRALNKQQFQLLFYLMIQKTAIASISCRNIEAGIISLKKFSAEFIPLQLSQTLREIPDSVIDKFHNFVMMTIDELLDPDIPFFTTKDADKCRFCEFAAICNYFHPISNDEDDE